MNVLSLFVVFLDKFSEFNVEFVSYLFFELSKFNLNIVCEAFEGLVDIFVTFIESLAEDEVVLFLLFGVHQFLNVCRQLFILFDLFQELIFEFSLFRTRPMMMLFIFLVIFIQYGFCCVTALALA